MRVQGSGPSSSARDEAADGLAVRVGLRLQVRDVAQRVGGALGREVLGVGGLAARRAAGMRLDQDARGGRSARWRDRRARAGERRSTGSAASRARPPRGRSGRGRPWAHSTAAGRTARWAPGAAPPAPRPRNARAAAAGSASAAAGRSPPGTTGGPRRGRRRDRSALRRRSNRPGRRVRPVRRAPYLLDGATRVGSMWKARACAYSRNASTRRGSRSSAVWTIALVLSGMRTWKMPPKNAQAASHASMAVAVVSRKTG